MKEIYNLIFILTTIGIFFSCDSKTPEYYGQWKIIEGYNTNRIIEISGNSLRLYKKTEDQCDSSFCNPEVLKITDLQNDNNTTIIKVTSELYSIEFEMRFKTPNSGEFCFIYEGENICLQFEKSEINLDSILRVENSENNKYKNFIADKIFTFQNEFENLTENKKFESRTEIILSYIDSLCVILLLEYHLDFSSIECWNNIDSLLNTQIATNFLIGFDTGFIDRKYNAFELENKLKEYLQNKNKEFDVNIIFPTFHQVDFYERTSNGIHTLWYIKKFYQVPLGEVITQLIDLKIKVVQMEKIIKTKE